MSAVQNLQEMTGLLPFGARLSLQSTGVITAQVGGVAYVVSPSVFVQKQPNPSGVPNFTTGSDGYLRFIHSAGNVQILHPAFADVGALGHILRSLDSHSMLSIQLDGTASIQLDGKAYTLVPDMSLGAVPADRVGQTWWQESATRYRLLNQQTPGTSQGFTVRP